MEQKTNKGNKISLASPPRGGGCNALSKRAAFKVTQNFLQFIASKYNLLFARRACYISTYKLAFNSISKRHVSTNKPSPSEGLHNSVPVSAYYSNLEIMKKKILLDNKGKSGVYRIINMENNKTYVGSSINLYARFHVYFNIKKISEGGNRNLLICKALVKYGYSRFSLQILEYCEKENVLAREQYYLDLLQPEYNIQKIAGSPQGYKHTEASRKKMRGKRVYSLEHTDKLRERALLLNAVRRIKVEVFDTVENVSTMYDSIREASKALNCRESSINSYEKAKAKRLLEKGEVFLYKKRYNITVFRGV